ncbi:uncharacterized protein [Nicotiana tomentosiformis]|uniref:uncharacterized protein n=1 Tax=Nicotiana tomentosiformis TaxID=4098 RepID=UPI00388CB783
MRSSLFWLENWTGLGALYIVTPLDFVCDESIHNIYDVVENDQWDEEKIREILPEELADHILLHMKPPVVHDVLDNPQWMLETRGVFSVKSAWEYLRRRNEPVNAYKKIWCGKTSSLWMISSGDWGILWLQSVGAGVEIFSGSCRNYYAGDYIPSSSDQVLDCRCDPSIAAYCSSLASCFVLRNEERDIVYGCGKKVQEGTNIEAEAKAILEALRFCVEHDYGLIDLHTDSMMLKNILNGERSVPWVISARVEEIKELMARSNVTVAHTLREGNSLADQLANYALDVGSIEAHNFWELDIKGRRIVNSDKLQCPYLRVKVARN